MSAVDCRLTSLGWLNSTFASGVGILRYSRKSRLDWEVERMSLELVRQEIDGFVAGKDASVLCLRGPWGVGKTYTWDSILRNRAGTNGVGLDLYSYVSLFGVNSLDALRAAVFENTVSTKHKNLIADETTVADLLGKLTSKGRPWARFVENIPIAKSWVPPGLTAALTFLSVRKTLVCFDDLERRGKGLDLADVLGLASMLRDRRGCRVVLLLNEERLDDTDRATFYRYLEKVSDAAVRFDPTSQEAVAIAHTGSSPISKPAAELCRALGIRNIRVMKKIDRTIASLQTLAADHDSRIFDVLARSGALFAWSHHEPDEAPPLAFLKTYNTFVPPQGDQDPRIAAWSALLSAYGYTHTDELDLLIMRGVENGYFDTTLLQDAIGKLEDNLIAADSDASFQKAWDLYHDSFDNNGEEVLNAIEAAFRLGATRITPTNLNGTVSLFKQLGHPQRASALVEFYIEARSSEPRRFFNLDEYTFRDNITEQEVIDAFAEKAASAPEERDFAELLAKLRHGWSQEDIDALAALPEDEYESIFRAAKGQDLRQILAGALSFDSVVNATPEMKEIPRRARVALQRIAAQSPINARRAAQWGIAVDGAGATPPATVTDAPGAPQ